MDTFATQLVDDRAERANPLELLISGITRTLDLRWAAVIEEPTTGWITWRPSVGDDAWAVQFMS